MGSENLEGWAEIVMGQSPPGAKCNTDGQGLALLNGPTEFGSHHPTPIQFTVDARKRALPGDILFCVRGSTTGRMNWADQEYAIGRGIAAIRHKKDPRLNHFVRAVIEYALADLLAQATGSTFPNVSYRQLATLWYPPLKDPEQQAIAAILGALDDKIELNRRMNRTLEGMARALFKSWFVDFDPVRAKAAGHAPPRLKPEIAALFPDSFEDSELGEIPKGWGVGAIGDMVQVLGGGTPSTKEPAYWENGAYPFCTPKDMSSLTDPVLLQTERHLTEEGLTKVSSGQLPVGTVLLSSRAPIGYLAIAEVPVSINQGIIAMVCSDELPSLYVLFWTRTNMDRITANANGSTFLEISKRNFRPILAIVPSMEILRQFTRIVEPLYCRIVVSLCQGLRLASLRDALLPKLISGELRAPDAERIVGRVV